MIQKLFKACSRFALSLLYRLGLLATTQPVMWQSHWVGDKCNCCVSWQWHGQTYVYKFAYYWKSITETKARISLDAARGCYSWDQATYAKELIDAMTEGVK